VEGERLVLHYLGPRDEPWLRGLLEVCARFAGRKQLELRERLKEPMALSAPRNKLRLAMQVLERTLPESPQREPSPRDLRFRVFRAAARGSASRDEVLAGVAHALRLEAATVEDDLFADLASQRRLGALPSDLSASRLALLTNQALVLAFLKRAEKVRVRAWGNTHALVRHARALGLICTASRAAEPDGVLLEISGPFALFRKTEVYGRSLASLLPIAAHCRHFELEADCVLSRGSVASTLRISPADPIYPARALPSYASRVEARFARDFAALTRAWDLRRDPEPIDAAGWLVFPHFELLHHEDPGRRWSLEIVGFWTAESVREKLAKVSAAGSTRLILCVDEARRCSEAHLAPHPQVLRYKSRVDAAQVLALIESGNE